METLCKLYLELANVVPENCVSSRDMRKLKHIDSYGIALMMIAEGCDDPQRVAQDAINKWNRK